MSTRSSPNLPVTLSPSIHEVVSGQGHHHSRLHLPTCRSGQTCRRDIQLISPTGERRSHDLASAYSIG
ncbi:hypothetical protein EGR_00540 [Echinococcus granulosus]|uniref:Uncharacterized protein n=1 Tax=Echinococcus granulosus TaxID=6210 RepID=W6USI0_ECHGR|nr:hypothetical protein EGR_00540 [Echinococcus granulosus]EUB64590.1 hypothetical protein EGR_00540 [Echinococcus granulosus]